MQAKKPRRGVSRHSVPALNDRQTNSVAGNGRPRQGAVRSGVVCVCVCVCVCVLFCSATGQLLALLELLVALFELRQLLEVRQLGRGVADAAAQGRKQALLFFPHRHVAQELHHECLAMRAHAHARAPRAACEHWYQLARSCARRHGCGGVAAHHERPHSVGLVLLPQQVDEGVVFNVADRNHAVEGVDDRHEQDAHDVALRMCARR